MAKKTKSQTMSNDDVLLNFLKGDEGSNAKLEIREKTLLFSGGIPIAARTVDNAGFVTIYTLRNPSAQLAKTHQTKLRKLCSAIVSAGMKPIAAA